VTDCIDRLSFEKLHQQRIADIGLDKVKPLDFLSRLLCIQADDVIILLSRQPSSHSSAPVASHAGDENVFSPGHTHFSYLHTGNLLCQLLLFRRDKSQPIAAAAATIPAAAQSQIRLSP